MDPLLKIVDDLTAAARKNPGPEHEEMLATIYRLRDVLIDILHEAEDLEFHDFANEKYATPKVALVERLLLIGLEVDGFVNEVKQGKYDNSSPK